MDTPASASAAPARGANALTLLLVGAVVAVGAIFVLAGSIAVPNEWYAAFKAIHVTFAVIWIGGGVLLTVSAIRAQRAMNPAEIVAIARQAAFAGERIFAPAGLIVFLMGIAMMINTSWGWSHFWVIFGLVGYATTFTTGIAVLSPLAKKIEAATEQHGAESPITLALIDRIMLLARIDIAVLLCVVLDMVTKPFA